MRSRSRARKKPTAKPRPRGKLDRLGTQGVRRLWGLLYRAVRRQSHESDQLRADVEQLGLRVRELQRQIDGVRRLAVQAHSRDDLRPVQPAAAPPHSPTVIMNVRGEVPREPA